MLRPTKFLNLDNCVIHIVSEILSILTQENSIAYSDLYLLLKKKYNNDFEINFLPAIDFLFLLGKIKYSPTLDNLELIK